MKTSAKTIITAWLIAGTLDISAAVISFLIFFNGKLIELFQYIASGLFGMKAFSGGLFMAAMGLLFHYFIALSWTVFFYIMYPRLKFLRKNNFLSGILYGIFIWLVMNLIVLELSRVHSVTFGAAHTITGILILMFCVGLPISLIVGNYYSRTQNI